MAADTEENVEEVDIEVEEFAIMVEVATMRWTVRVRKTVDVTVEEVVGSARVVRGRRRRRERRVRRMAGRRMVARLSWG